MRGSLNGKHSNSCTLSYSHLLAVARFFFFLFSPSSTSISVPKPPLLLFHSLQFLCCLPPSPFTSISVPKPSICMSHSLQCRVFLRHTRPSYMSLYPPLRYYVDIYPRPTALRESLYNPDPTTRVSIIPRPYHVSLYHPSTILREPLSSLDATT